MENCTCECIQQERDGCSSQRKLSSRCRGGHRPRASGHALGSHTIKPASGSPLRVHHDDEPIRRLVRADVGNTGQCAKLCTQENLVGIRLKRTRTLPRLLTSNLLEAGIFSMRQIELKYSQRFLHCMVVQRSCAITVQQLPSYCSSGLI